VIRIDRPFVFAIRERLSGTILFLGKIVRPPAWGCRPSASRPRPAPRRD